MIVGIDPGKTGAIAWAMDDWGPSKACVISMPEFEVRITSFLRSLQEQALHLGEDVKCYLEKQAYMQGDGGKGIATYMQHYGFLLGSMRMLEWSIDIVPPMTWKKQQSVLVSKTPVPRGSDAKKKAKMARDHKKKLKDASIARAMSLFPTIDFGTNRKNQTEGRSEALLIMQYGRELTTRMANAPTPQWEIDDGKAAT